MLSHSLVRSATRDSMKITVPKEIKKQEYRVGLLPSVAYQLTQQGHTVLVERGAGAGSGYPDADYEQAGATLMDDHAALFAEGDLMVKVKEPLPEEYGLLLPGQVLFTYTSTSPPTANSPRPSAAPASPRWPTRQSRSTAACRCSSR